MIDALMYGMMPSAKTVIRDRSAAGEHVVEPEQRGSALLRQLLQRRAVDAGRRDVAADAVHARAARA